MSNFNPRPKPAKFETGQVVATPGALEAVARNVKNFGNERNDLFKLLDRHVSGDWGDVCDEDKELNNQALGPDTSATDEMHARVLSAYTLGDGTKIWIITEWDRSVTTILLPEEY